MSEQTSWIKQTSATHVGLGGQEWWRTSAVYQVYPRSWADSNGDGVGDLPGITAKLPYLRDLGVDALWISPFYTSPMADAGYDVADYRDIDPLFGTLADADKLIARAHELDLRVIVDLVPNHSSDEHEWFKAALAAGPGSPERERYLFRDGKGENGELPPNDWQAIFGGNAWTRVSDADGNPEQWYLHLFDPKQPDFNWNNPEVRDEFVSILTFWLDRGVDGFRVDVAHSLIKADGLPDHAAHAQMAGTGDASHDNGGPMWDQEGVHEIYRAWRELLDSYNPRDTEGYDSAADRAMCAEAWVSPPERLARYVRPDEFHQAFNFAFLETPWRAADLHESITSSYRSNDSVGAPTTWVLSNHDVVRHATRLALPVGQPRPNGIRAEDPQPDAALGLRRALAATALELALPGGAYLYQGEELGLPDHTTMPDEARQDPTWERSEHTEAGRDGCRVPMPWVKDAPSFGFGPSEATWLPQPEVYGDLAVDQQDGVAGSTLEFYRRMLRERHARELGSGSLTWVEGAGDDVLAFVNSRDGHEDLWVVTNFGEPVALPDDAFVVLSSGEADSLTVERDVTVWFTRA
ncbi:glycoside hydrolase family 13 protein [Dermacoccus nishinomiyaensis]|uniref:glycoside hydrolase family 13 protein n=1 Tax=Dermacoccus TaxID=57495 RepID=UPI0009E6B2BD|nr:glycoside hydrolase family 13 protein [Dermacoccus sp. NHGro5]PZP00060.1 MAG: alpha-amylase [Dermacoccus nishinomiyaensis]TCJ91282.1 alpha-glucosidase [Dermacoccus sp. SAI-028]TJZ96918.1 glycoside hydrolase family 13 protein [Dermacoccus nishinomiyaensis]HCQ19059.1 alpha-amylase [Dermacoccus sp.]